MNRLAGIICMVGLLYASLMITRPQARSAENHQNLARRMSLYGIPTIGAAVLIISGGIDLSIGSVVCLSGVCLGIMLEDNVPPWPACAIILLASPLIGLAHGLLVTKLRLQPFIVTLCGFFVYRGLANLAVWWFRGTIRTVGLGEPEHVGAWAHFTKESLFGVPAVMVIFLGVALAAGVFLHASVHGRYLYAVGFNEKATQYAGVATDLYKIVAYMICSALAGMGGILEMLDLQSAQPSSLGTSWELYAITGAVLGGCSLRGGEGNVLGVLLGAAVLPMLRNFIQLLQIPPQLEQIIIGLALLLGTVVDEVSKRFGPSRRIG